MNSNGPLQVGGLYFGKDRLRDLAAELKVARETLPAGDSFAGCLRDLQVSENDGSPLWISLGTPADGEQYQVPHTIISAVKKTKNAQEQSFTFSTIIYAFLSFNATPISLSVYYF